MTEYCPIIKYRTAALLHTVATLQQADLSSQHFTISKHFRISFTPANMHAAQIAAFKLSGAQALSFTVGGILPTCQRQIAPQAVYNVASCLAKNVLHTLDTPPHPVLN